VKFAWRWVLLLSGCLGPFAAFGQIDPVKRDLFQLGYNAALQGHAPLSGYVYYYRNQPDFFRTNLTLRLAIAPTYLDSELGISHLLGPNTDLGIGLAGGGFADSYSEVRRGKYEPKESFTGNGAEVSVSIYHLFNPSQQIPLNGVLRGIVHYSTFSRDDLTANDFSLPSDRETFEVRAGLRWGGKEPLLFPSLAMELSVWYQGEYRSDSGAYGFAGDRRVEPDSHLFWGQALLAYTLPNLKHNFYVSLIAGTSVDADRFSAYRLGALLPLGSEFPLSLPGYYYQELSAQRFVLLGGAYLLPLDKKQRWSLDFNAATAGVDYVSGLEQPGHWHSGVGGGVLFKSQSWKVLAGYGYGIDAIRSGGRGAHSIGLLVQLDLKNAREAMINPSQPNLWQGMQRMFGLFGN